MRRSMTCASLALLGLSLFAGCYESTNVAALPDESLQTSELALQRTVDPAKELVITDPSVIASPQETTFSLQHVGDNSGRGAWSFGRLIHNMLPATERTSSAAASRFVLQWLRRWEVDQQPNPTATPARALPGVRMLIITPWKEASGCSDPANPVSDDGCVLDMSKAPFRLMAIVNRPDLRIVGNDSTAIGGEGRFVFQLIGQTLGIDGADNLLKVMSVEQKAQKFTVIFEYSLPVKKPQDTLDWAGRWHSLGDLPFGDKYNQALGKITEAFSGANSDIRRPNGSALNQLRTNEVATFGARFPGTGFVAAKQFWELREFHLSESGLVPHTVKLEPPRALDVARPGQLPGDGTRTSELISYLQANASAVLAEKHALPPELSANSALVGSAPFGAWGKLINPNPPTIPSQGVAHDLPGVPVDVRDKFAINTCAGCHRHETDTRHFMHITTLGAMEPLSKVDDRTRIGADASTPDSTVVLSNMLRTD
ncbi:MAG: hypothetical protein JWN04_6478, partial [Myxococcaceae bacterium]|nr:hypothetical protein [Myxococcaceae bacterium]